MGEGGKRESGEQVGAVGRGWRVLEGRNCAAGAGPVYRPGGPDLETQGKKCVVFLPAEMRLRTRFPLLQTRSSSRSCESVLFPFAHENIEAGDRLRVSWVRPHNSW